MGIIIQNALFHGVAALLLLAVFVPVAILFLAWFVFMVVESIREFLK